MHLPEGSTCSTHIEHDPSTIYCSAGINSDGCSAKHTASGCTNHTNRTTCESHTKSGCASHDSSRNTCQTHTELSSCKNHISDNACHNHVNKTSWFYLWLNHTTKEAECTNHVNSPIGCTQHVADVYCNNNIYRSRCESNEYPYVEGKNVAIDTIILDEQINELIDAVNAEAKRRADLPANAGPSETLYDEQLPKSKSVPSKLKVYEGKKILINDGINDDQRLESIIAALRDCITTMSTQTSVTFVENSTNKFRAATYNEIKDNLANLEHECLCNCNYCTCNCNYCLCNCDYCTCFCNYNCTCNCNYSCTCVCNYCTCQCYYSCTCVCNYTCTCKCNYSCTCNCNYCTCNCDYCTCNCAYTCTCFCNY